MAGLFTRGWTLLPQTRNPNVEILNKSKTRKLQTDQSGRVDELAYSTFKVVSFAFLRFCHLKFEHLNLFRISIFEFRISITHFSPEPEWKH